MAAGEDSRLDGNLAAVEAERGHNQLAVLDEQLLQARAELATALQLPATTLPETVGELRAMPMAATLETLQAAARERPLLRSLESSDASALKREFASENGTELNAVLPKMAANGYWSISAISSSM